MTLIPVVGGVLKWAREERHLTVADAARILGMDEAVLVALEEQDVRPNVGTLRDMAAGYRIAFAALLMPEPLPRSGRPNLPDYRTVGGVAPAMTPALQEAIDEVWEFVDALAEIRDQDPGIFPGTQRIPLADMNRSAKSQADAERARLGFTIEAQVGCKTSREAFLRWREVIERQGVFVHLKKLYAKDNCGGFAVFDERNIPFILLNSSEDPHELDYNPRIFGLLHEYCHIMMRQSAISDYHRRSNTIERFCNSFAAHVLMPEDRLRQEYALVGATPSTIGEGHLRKLSAKFHVSMSAIAIHAESLRLAPDGFYNRLHAVWAKRGARHGSGRASHEEKLANRFGVRYIDTVLTALDRGMINKSDVLELTSIKPKYYAVVKQEIRARTAAYGVG